MNRHGDNQIIQSSIFLMRYIFFFNIFLCLNLNAQPETSSNKPTIDSAAISKWPKFFNDNVAISNSGEYCYYIISKPKQKNVLMVQSTFGGWKKNIDGAWPIGFSPDSRKLIYRYDNSVYEILLGTDNSKRLAEDIELGDLSNNKNDFVVSWRTRASKENVTFYDPDKEITQLIPSISNYSFNPIGKSILFFTTQKFLIWLDFVTQKRDTIWEIPDTLKESSTINSFYFDKSGNQIVFSLRQKFENGDKYSLWYYRKGLPQPLLKVNSDAVFKKYNLSLSPALRFSSDGRYIFLSLKKTAEIPPVPSNLKLDVWSYKDTILQSTQRYKHVRVESGNYDAVVSVDDTSVIVLQNEFGDYVQSLPAENHGDHVVIGRNINGDRFWLPKDNRKWLVSLRNGQKALLPNSIANTYTFSPDGQYIVYYDQKERNYFSYHITTGRLTNVSAGIKNVNLEIEQKYLHGYKSFQEVGIAAWDSLHVFVYDNFDIWCLDLTGKETPRNVTEGYGKRNKIKFRFFDCKLSKKEAVLIAFNSITKENGFFTVNLSEEGFLRLCTMSRATFFHPVSFVYQSQFFDRGMEPIKAWESNVWLVKRQSSTESPNLFATRDFKSFTQLSTLTPEKKYNWLSSELVTWRQSNGYQTQGVLYKPENFDSSKKYPVIFVIYEQLSDRLNQYPVPEFNTAFINIPWFVSRGYLVFTPDIHFTIGKRGESALNAVISGARKLSAYSFIDTSRMAVVGHSYSGLMINYIVTHSNLFSAAIASAGTSDEISSSLQLLGNGFEKTDSRLGSAEFQMGASIWDRPDLYLNEATVLSADKVTTPLVLFHSITDGMPFEQPVEMFIALRRLNRKVWLLQYDDAGHGASGNKDAQDYTVRITQYFDHYLKHAAAPRWMTSGIRYEMRGVDLGLDFDPGGKCGGDCKICNSFEEKEIAGKWSLTETKNIHGFLYSNAVPKQINVIQQESSAIIERVFDGSEKDVVTKETLYFNGKTFETQTPSKRKKMITAKWIKSKNEMIAIATIHNPINNKLVETKTIEHWQLKQGQLFLNKRSENYLTGEVWETVGKYRKDKVSE
jgi:hypothetical protein